MTKVARLMNWTEEDRRKGNAFIQIIQSGTPTVTVTVAVGQSAKTALTTAGWKIASGVRKDKGWVTFLVEREYPGLAGANAMVSRLVSQTRTV